VARAEGSDLEARGPGPKKHRSGVARGEGSGDLAARGPKKHRSGVARGSTIDDLE
jgi:uncharacterized protein YciI